MRNSVRHALATTAIVATLAMSASARAQAPLEIGTTAGPVVGAAVDGIEAWLGIPYAAAPVGPLRWRPPEPVAG